MFSKAMLLDQLTKQISEIERAALENGGKGLVISQYKRATILRMLLMEKGGGTIQVSVTGNTGGKCLRFTGLYRGSSTGQDAGIKVRIRSVQRPSYRV